MNDLWPNLSQAHGARWTGTLAVYCVVIIVAALSV